MQHAMTVYEIEEETSKEGRKKKSTQFISIPFPCQALSILFLYTVFT